MFNFTRMNLMFDLMSDTIQNVDNFMDSTFNSGSKRLVLYISN